MSPRARLVVAVTADRIALAFSVRGAIIAEESGAQPGGVANESAVRELVERVACTNARRTTVDLLVAKPIAVRKALFGIAATSPADDVRLRLREAPHSFFLGDAGSIITSEPALLHGAWWAAAVDGAVLDALLKACGSLSIDRCRVVAIENPLDAAGLAAAARAAALQPAIDPLALLPLAGIRRERGRSRRLRLLSMAFMLGLGGASLGPTSYHASLARREAARLASLEAPVNATQAWAYAMATQRLDDALRLASLARRAPLRTPLFASLGKALPDAAVVISLAIDSTAGSVVVLAPPGRDVLAAVAAVARIGEARLDGAVTRERFLERDVNRTTLAFRIVAAEGSP